MRPVANDCNSEKYTNFEHIFLVHRFSDDDDDPNTISCVDPQLRAEIRSVLYEAASCKVSLSCPFILLPDPVLFIGCRGYIGF